MEGNKLLNLLLTFLILNIGTLLWCILGTLGLFLIGVLLVSFNWLNHYIGLKIEWTAFLAYLFWGLSLVTYVLGFAHAIGQYICLKRFKISESPFMNASTLFILGLPSTFYPALLFSLFDYGEYYREPDPFWDHGWPYTVLVLICSLIWAGILSYGLYQKPLTFIQSKLFKKTKSQL